MPSLSKATVREPLSILVLQAKRPTIAALRDRQLFSGKAACPRFVYQKGL